MNSDSQSQELSFFQKLDSPFNEQIFEFMEMYLRIKNVFDFILLRIINDFWRRRNYL